VSLRSGRVWKGVWWESVHRGFTGLYELDAKQRGEAKRIEGEEKGETFFCVYCAGLLALFFLHRYHYRDKVTRRRKVHVFSLTLFPCCYCLSRIDSFQYFVSSCKSGCSYAGGCIISQLYKTFTITIHFFAENLSFSLSYFLWGLSAYTLLGFVDFV
jgi:hypothetical protein